MRHAKSRLVEDADESAPVRLETAPTGVESVYLFLGFIIVCKGDVLCLKQFSNGSMKGAVDV